MGKTSIEWTRGDDGSPGMTWNPTTGCTKVSPGCDHCYALTMHERFNGKGSFDTVTLHPDRLTLPLHWRKPRRVFVNSMSDLFHKDVPDEFIARVFAVMAFARQHTFQVLTKRHARMRALLNDDDFIGDVAQTIAGWSVEDGIDIPEHIVMPERGSWWPLPNVWVGVSVEDQKWADIRIPALLETPAAVRFLSCEPLLGPIDFRLVPGFNRIHLSLRNWWVIVGGESGPGARPMHPDWARRLRDQCAAAQVPFLFKQWGQWSPMAPLRNGKVDWMGAHPLANDGTLYAPGDLAYPDGPRYGEALRADHGRAHLTHMYRVGKKKAGRELDGQTHDEYPNPKELQ